MMHRLLAECSADGRASLARLTDTSLRDAGNGLLNRHGYVLNAADQRTKVSRTNSAATAWNGYGIYTYDAAGEVRTARAYDGSGAAVASENFDYGYDAGWNLLKRTNNTAVTPYVIHVLNQISNDGGSSWVHGANGNLTFRPNAGSSDLSYAYDAENQLLSVVLANTSKIEFTYDGLGRLRIRKDYTWATPGGTWLLSGETRYLYDGMLLVQDRSSANNPLVTYTRGTDLSGSLDGAGGIGGLLSRGVHATTSPYAVSTSAYYHADGNGNVTLLVGSGSPSVKAYYKYAPFGQTLASGGSLASDNVMRFSSKPVMGSSGLYYYGYRFYDPTSQRWLNRDPLEDEASVVYLVNGLQVFDVESQLIGVSGPFELWSDSNLYTFVGNNSVKFIDPFGLSSIDASVGHAVATGNVDALECLLVSGELSPSQTAIARAALDKYRQTAIRHIAKNCKGSISREFPTECYNKTLGELRSLSQTGDKVARKAWKLINDGRFRKGN